MTKETGKQDDEPMETVRHWTGKLMRGTARPASSFTNEQLFEKKGLHPMPEVLDEGKQ